MQHCLVSGYSVGHFILILCYQLHLNAYVDLSRHILRPFLMCCL